MSTMNRTAIVIGLAAATFAAGIGIGALTDDGTDTAAPAADIEVASVVDPIPLVGPVSTGELDLDLDGFIVDEQTPAPEDRLEPGEVGVVDGAAVPAGVGSVDEATFAAACPDGDEICRGAVPSLLSAIARSASAADATAALCSDDEGCRASVSATGVSEPAPGATATTSDTTPDTTVSPGSDASATEDDGTPGSARVVEPPPLVDLCAAGSGYDCADGVGGTVLLALGEPIEIGTVAMRRELNPLCEDVAELADDQLVIVVTTNQPVELAGSAALDAGGDAIALAATTSPAAVAVHDSSPSYFSAVTCAVFTRDRAEGFLGDAYRVELALSASPDVSATYSDVLASPPRGLRPVDLRPVVFGDERARPPIEVSVRGTDVYVRAAVYDDEYAQVSFPARDSDRPDVARCAEIEDDPYGSLSPFEWGLLDRRTPIATLPDERFSGLAAWEQHIAQLAPHLAGVRDICVVIYQDTAPPRALERHAIPVTVPEPDEYQVFVRFLQVPTVSGATPQPPDAVSMTLRGTGGSCSGRVEVAPILNRLGEIPLCQLTLTSETDGVGMLGQVVYENREFGPLRRSLLTAPSTWCSGRPIEGCDVTFESLLPLPEDRAGAAGVSALVAYSIRRTSATVGGEVGIGSDRPYGEADESGEVPRLVLGSVSMRPARDDPAGALEVSWESDRPADVLATATFVPDRYGGALRACSGGGELGALDSGGATSGTIRLDGACAGSTYRLSLLVRDAGSTGWQVAYGLGDIASTGLPVVEVDVTATTEPVRVLLSYRYDVAVPGVDVQPSFIPTVHSASVGGVGEYFSQPYSGRARTGLVCEPLDRWSRDEGPTEVALAGVVRVHADATLHRWSARNDCPDARNQLRHDAAEVSGSFRFDVTTDIELEQLLRGVTITRDVPAGSRSVRVTFTISATIAEG